MDEFGCLVSVGPPGIDALEVAQGFGRVASDPHNVRSLSENVDPPTNQPPAGH